MKLSRLPAAAGVRMRTTVVAITMLRWLSPAREFGLLEFLLWRPGSALSKNEILNHVWDAHYDGDENVVEVYVGYLRRKIETLFGTHTIETVRGTGYRLRNSS